MTSTKSLPHTPFYFIRHGQTDWNKERRYMGQTDIPLNATGIAQAQTAAQNLQKISFSKIFSSPLQRALQTATIIGQTTNKEVIIIDELKEGCWGVMEGKDKGDEAWYDHWIQGHTMEGAEA